MTLTTMKIVGNDELHHQGDAVSTWMMDLVAEEKAARKKEKISNFDLKSIIGVVAQQQYRCLGMC